MLCGCLPTLLIDTIPMPSVLEAVCCSAEKLQDLESTDDSRLLQDIVC